LILSELETQDYLANFDSLTMLLVDNLFKVQEKTQIPYSKKSDHVLEVTFEINPNLLQYEREVYNAFDFISDIGGF
jgi:hypothetical protein